MPNIIDEARTALYSVLTKLGDLPPSDRVQALTYDLVRDTLARLDDLAMAADNPDTLCTCRCGCSSPKEPATQVCTRCRSCLVLRKKPA